MNQHTWVPSWLVLCCCLCPVDAAQEDGTPALENDHVALRFDQRSGSLVALTNKLIGETYNIRGDKFQIDAVEFQLDFADATLESLEHGKKTVVARYRHGPVSALRISRSRLASLVSVVIIVSFVVRCAADRGVR